MVRYIFSILLLLISITVNATKYYIDTTGVDDAGRNGGIGQEWKTLAYACTRVTTPGDTIHVNAGTYYETTTALLAVGVNIIGEGNSSILTSSSTSSSYRIITAESVNQNTSGNNTISYLKLDGNSDTVYVAIRIRNRGNFVIHHCTIIDFYSIGIDQYNGSGSGEPSNYATGFKIHDCTIDNSSLYSSASNGNVQISGLEGAEIYNNSITCITPGINKGILIKGTNKYFKGLKIYNNKLLKIHTGSNLPFSIELWDSKGGIEIYNNIIWGEIDLVRCVRGSYSFGAKIHNNIIGENISATKYHPALGLEWSSEYIYFYHNYVQNMVNAVSFSGGGGSTVMDNIWIYYNIFKNIGSLNDDIQYQRAMYAITQRYTCTFDNTNNRITYSASIPYTFNENDHIRFQLGSGGSYPSELNGTTIYTIINVNDYTFQVSTDGINPIDFSTNGSPTVYVRSLAEYKNIHICNNVLQCKEEVGPYPVEAGIYFEAYGSIDNWQIINNIIIGFKKAPIWGRQDDANPTNFIIKNNIFYNNGNSNEPYYDYGFTPDSATYILTNTIKDDPLFINSEVNYRLQLGSPAIDAGIDVGLTSDYDGISIPRGLKPDIGAFEYVNLPVGTAGLGWESALSKRNFKDEVNFAQSRLMIDAIPITATAEEINTLVGVTSGIQSQIDTKALTLNAAVATGTITDATGITSVMLKRYIYYSEAAATDITSNPQIVNGAAGQIITIIGSSDTNTLTLDDGDGLRLSAQCVLGAGDTITLYYDGTLADWIEIGRSNN